MTQAQWVRWGVKPVVFAVALIPAALLVRDVIAGNLAAEPIKDITHRTGLATLQLLLATLLVTPLRRITRIGSLITLRRMLGLFAFSYATLHFTIYGLDQTVLAGTGLSPSLILEDVAKRPYITVGFTAFLLLIPLALTSTKGWVKRLGGKRWQALHRAVYVAAALGALHFLWLVKADVSRPITYGLGLIGLLSFRLWRQRRKAIRGRAVRRVPPSAERPGDRTPSGSRHPADSPLAHTRGAAS